MISRDFLASLHCPYCGSAFDLETQSPGETASIHYGIIRCACYRYPVIDGIAILRQRSGTADIVDRGVGYIEAGDFAGALNYAFHFASPVAQTPGRWERVRNLLRFRQRHAAPTRPAASLSFAQALKIHRPGSYADYLLYRHANNSFLAAIPLLLLLKDLYGSRTSPRPNLRILDLNCGVGHASFLARLLFPGISVVATDHDFVNLHLAHRYMVPETPCVCLDAELPLPFGDRYFDAVLCLDGLHYVRSKRALLKELDRSVSEEGIWLFPHLHNALVDNVSPGVPLQPADYQRCFDFLPTRLCVEADILGSFMRDQVLDLRKSGAAEQLDRASVLSLVGSHAPDLFRAHEGLGEWIRPAASNLAVNPIYHCDDERGSVHLRMTWPNPTLERECEPVKEFLPRECDIDASLWGKLKSGTLRDEDVPGLSSLIKSFVLVPLPANYV